MTEKQVRRDAEALSRQMLWWFPARSAKAEKDRQARALKYYREFGGK